MKKLFGVAAAGLFAISMNACDITDVIDDVTDAAEQAKVEDTFGAAITQVTGQVVGVAFQAASDAMTAGTAPYKPQADLGTINVDETVALENGGTITVKGTITGSADENNTSLTLTLDSTWTGVPSVLDDGTVVTTSGSQTLTGSVTSTENSFSASFTIKGTMTVDGKSYAFEVALTSDGETVSYSGTVNGFPVAESVTLPADDENDEQAGDEWVCRVQTESADACTSYTPGALEAYVSAVCGGTVEAGPCAEATVGTCTTGAGTINEIVTHHYAGSPKANCEANGGIWADAN